MKVPPPPTPAAWLLARLVPNRQRAEILGDLEENHRLRAEHFGSRVGSGVWSHPGSSQPNDAGGRCVAGRLSGLDGWEG